MPDPFIIMSAPNGARRQKTDHPALPITPDELAHCAVEIRDAGASIIHLHVRDEENQHSLDVERYRAAITAIRAAIGHDLVIQVTSEAVGRYSRFEQMDMVKALKPEAVSLALREICPTDADLADTARFIDWMSAARVFPQYILYDEVDLARFEVYRKKGIFKNDTPFVLFVLGRYQANAPEAGKQPHPLIAQSHSADYPWAVCGFGTNEGDAIAHAAKSGGHIRVGFENNIWRKNEELLSGHDEMIAVCVNAGKRATRSIGTADDVRNMQHNGS